MTQSSSSIQFTGQGSEYFKIWIVNQFLSIVTLGIYSAWAKVRRNHYLYRHTWLDGANFDYHGDPISILKGRVVAVLLFGGYSMTGKFSPELSGIAFLLLAGVMPWLLVRSFRFRLHNTSYRALRFSFRGRLGRGYRVMLGYTLLSTLTLGLCWPWAMQRMSQYIHNNSWFGDRCFAMPATAGQFYRVYLKVGGLYLLAVALVFGAIFTGAGFNLDFFQHPQQHQTPQHQQLVGVLIAASFMVFAVILLTVYPYLQARMQNLIWDGMQLGNLRFRSNVRFRGMAWIMLGNTLLTVLTLGFYKPYADLRMLRYRLEHISVENAAELEQFVRGANVDDSAVGEEVTDIFDIDIAL